MKRLLILLFASLTLFTACGDEESGISAETSSGFSHTSAEESRFVPEEIFEYLTYEYSVTSRRTSLGVEYITDFYFADGLVCGGRIKAVFPDSGSALSYYEALAEDDDYVTIDGTTVTSYSDNEDDYYYGINLEKLKFVLEESGYSFTLNFDEEQFYQAFPTDNDE